MLKKLHIILLLLSASLALPTRAQEVIELTDPETQMIEEGTQRVTDGSEDNATEQNRRYNVQIDVRKAYISGICIVHEEDSQVTASIMNEFGVSALTYRYDTNKHKAKILSIMKPMNKWYIKRVLKSDLKKIMPQILANPEQTLQHENKKYNIRYNFSPLTNETAR